MNKKLQLLMLFLSLGISTTIFAQTVQSNFINYQGVASDASGTVMAEQSITVGIALIDAGTGAVGYAENHSVTTDANGVFSLQIGNGTGSTTDYDTFIRNGIASSVTVSINGTEIGTTELLAVPYAIRAGNVQWDANGDDIENRNVGTVKINNNLEVGGDIQLQLGSAVNEISIDGTLAGNSDKAIPTEKAVKTYIDANAGGGAQKIDDLEDAKSDGSSIFLGIDAGANDDGTSNLNVGIGKKALFKNTTGRFNVAIGSFALNDNTAGDENTAIGNGALSSNEIGKYNTAIGRRALWINLTGENNTAIGREALKRNTTGGSNTANGSGALRSNTTGGSNTANGRDALRSNTTGSSNTANGGGALSSNTTGNFNTANGVSALISNTTGIDNTANGVSALSLNTTGISNTATGRAALFSNTTGDHNTANGRDALFSNTTGIDNTANGVATLLKNTTGVDNTATGKSALRLNITGFNNTANGNTALYSNTEGSFNTATGNEALYSNTTGGLNTAIGNLALRGNITGSNNTAIGYRALINTTSGNNNTAVGYAANVPNATGSNQIRIGNNAVTYAGVQVAWTITSDMAWKDDIQPLSYGLNLVSQLKPVDYVRKNNEANTREMGFIAQDVELLLNKLGYINTGMLTTDDEGRLSLRYNDFIPVLTKAVQELNEKNSVLENKTSSLEKMNKELLKRIKALENK